MKKSVQIGTLEKGAIFRYDTVDAVASVFTHRVKENKGKVVVIECFCDRSVTTARDSSTLVFPIDALDS
jgi:hypothetical protein